MDSADFFLYIIFCETKHSNLVIYKQRKGWDLHKFWSDIQMKKTDEIHWKNIDV